MYRQRIQALYFWMVKETLGLPQWFSGKESPCQCRRHSFDSWVLKFPRRRKWQPTPVFLPGESYRQGNLAGSSLWGHKRVGHDLVTKNNNKNNKRNSTCAILHHLFKKYILLVQCEWNLVRAAGKNGWSPGQGNISGLSTKFMAGALFWNVVLSFINSET